MRNSEPATTNGSIPVTSTVAHLVEHQAAAGGRDSGRTITQGLRITDRGESAAFAITYAYGG